MSRHDPLVSLRHMRDHAHELTDIMRGRSRSDLDTDRLLALAVVRLLEIIGEAAARVPAEERTRRPGIPWSSIVGLRNRLIPRTGIYPVSVRGSSPIIHPLGTVSRLASRSL